MTDDGPRRRDVLGGIGLGIAGVALTGCVDDDDDDPLDEDTGGIAPQPLRNGSFEGRSVHTATGEFTPVARDLALPGRGEVSLAVVRKYRSSLADEVGRFGHGWTWGHDKRLRRDGNAVVYDTGRGEQYRFEPADDGSLTGESERPADADGVWTHPHFYAVLVELDDHVELRRNDGIRFVFESPSEGGRLLSYGDPGGNAYEFAYGDTEIRISDPRGAETVVSLNDEDTITAIEEPTGSTWEYRYGGDDGAYLIGVVRPDGSEVTYGYDDRGLLATLTGPGDDEPYLENAYERIDDAWRVSSQRHGEGSYDFWYEPVDQYRAGEATYPIYRTHVARKDRGSSREDANIHLTHGEAGLVFERTFEADTEELAEEALTDEERERGTATLVTESSYNDHLELTERAFPEGDVKHWTYATDHGDPRGRGNLLEHTHVAAPGKETDHEEVRTRQEWADVGEELAIFRVIGRIDPNGDRREFSYDAAGRMTDWRIPDVEHVDVRAGPGNEYTRDLSGRYEYNDYGQLVERTEWGTTTTYVYYDEETAGGPAVEEAAEMGFEAVEAASAGGGGGLLARVELDPGADASSGSREEETSRPRTGYVYDERGDVIARLDGKGSVARFERDELGRVTEVLDRAGDRRVVTRDEAGNPTALTHSFRRHQAHGEEVATVESERTLFWEYNQLDNVVAYGRRAEGEEHLVEIRRDENENVVERRRGELVVEYRYGDRNLPIEATWAPGTDDEASHSYRYARDGKPVAETDGEGRTIRREFGGLRRERATMFPNGLQGTNHYDPAGYLSRVQLLDAGSGDRASATREAERATAADGGTSVLGEARIDHDAAGRITAITQRRLAPPEDGAEPLGESGWDRETGGVKRIVEHGDAGPERVWSEPGAVTEYRYDEAGRLATIHSPAGFTNHLTYDANNAIVRTRRMDTAEFTGTSCGEGDVEGDSSDQEYRIERDVKGRPTAFVLNDEPKRLFEYNDNDQIIGVSDAEQTVQVLQDAHGRQLGSATRAAPSRSTAARAGTEAFEDEGDLIVRRRELDEHGRPVAMVDPEGGRVEVGFDQRNNPVEVRYPDGMTESAAYDAAGNLVEWVDPEGTEFRFQYDESDNLVGELVAGREQALTYERDATGRIVRATDESTGIEVVRAYDSMGNVLRDSVDGRTLERAYDGAGNATRIVYPEGPDIRNEFDEVGRLTSVRTADGEPVWHGRRDAEFLDEEVYGDGVLTAHTRYETSCSAGRVSRRWFEDASGGVVDGTAYEYETVGTMRSRTWLRYGETATDHFQHDTTKRLTAVDHAIGNGIEYDYSKLDTVAGATLTDADGGESRQLPADTGANFRMTSFGVASFEHDRNLNRIRESGFDLPSEATVEPEFERREYDFDPWNRLVTVRCLDGGDREGKRVEWTYDPFNRPIRKEVLDQRTGERTGERFTWAGNRLVQLHTSTAAAHARTAGSFGGASLGTASENAVGAGSREAVDTVGSDDDDSGSITSLLYGPNLVQIRSDNDEGGDDEDDDETDRWWVLDDGRGTNVGVLDESGELVEEYVIDGLGIPNQVKSPAELDRSAELDVIEDSLLPTLDAFGESVFDIDGFELGRDNHFGDMMDSRFDEALGGRRGRGRDGFEGGLDDMFSEFESMAEERLQGAGSWSQAADFEVGIRFDWGFDGESGSVEVDNVEGKVGVGGVSTPWLSPDLESNIPTDEIEDAFCLFNGCPDEDDDMDPNDPGIGGGDGSDGGDGGEGGDGSDGGDDGDGGDGSDGGDGGDSGDGSDGGDDSNGGGDDGSDGSDSGSGNDDDSDDSDDSDDDAGEGGTEGGNDGPDDDESDSTIPARGPGGGSGGGGCGPTMLCDGPDSEGEFGNDNIIIPGVNDDDKCGPAMICLEDEGTPDEFRPGVGFGLGGDDGCGPRMLCPRDQGTPTPRGGMVGILGICGYVLCDPDGGGGPGAVAASANDIQVDVFAKRGPASFSPR